MNWSFYVKLQSQPMLGHSLVFFGFFFKDPYCVSCRSVLPCRLALKEKKERLDSIDRRNHLSISLEWSSNAAFLLPCYLMCSFCGSTDHPALLNVQWEGAMHDLCTRPEPPEPLQHFSPITASTVGGPEPPAGPEHPEQEKREKETGTSDTVNMANLGCGTITNGNASMLGKRHHSLYEDFNNQGFRKVSRLLGNEYDATPK